MQPSSRLRFRHFHLHSCGHMCMHAHLHPVNITYIHSYDHHHTIKTPTIPSQVFLALTIEKSSPPVLLPYSRQSSDFHLSNFALARMLCKWSHTLLNLLVLTFFISNIHLRSMQVVVYISILSCFFIAA